jgi:hypothetical protein
MSAFDRISHGVLLGGDYTEVKEARRVVDKTTVDLEEIYRLGRATLSPLFKVAAI